MCYANSNKRFVHLDLEHSDWLVRNPAECNDIQLKLPVTIFSY